MTPTTSVSRLAEGYLRDLVRIDTTNPPGNELAAAEYVAHVLRAEGMNPLILEPAPGRGSVIVRLRGSGAGRPLLLLSHLDVVPADPREWDHPPFAADVADGYIWGRGTTDTKNLTAIELAILVTLKRLNAPLERDIILAGTADEEAGGANGMTWLLENHADLLDCEYAINEGGGDGLELAGRRFFTCQTGEKGVCWLKLTVRGTAGHGSMPRPDNAVARLCAAVARVAEAKLPLLRTATVERLVQALSATLPSQAADVFQQVFDPAMEEAALSQVQCYPEIVSLLRATLHNTVSPTMLQAGSKANVIPGEASATLDCRVMPGETTDGFLRQVRPYLGQDVEVEFIMSSLGYESEPGSPLFDRMGQVLAEHDPGCILAPYLVPGATDGRMLAEHGVKVYGFCPMRDEPNWHALNMAHAKNERLSLANLEFGSRVLYDLVSRFCS